MNMIKALEKDGLNAKGEIVTQDFWHISKRMDEAFMRMKTALDKARMHKIAARSEYGKAEPGRKDLMEYNEQMRLYIVAKHDFGNHQKALERALEVGE